MAATMGVRSLLLSLVVVSILAAEHVLAFITTSPLVIRRKYKSESKSFVNHPSPWSSRYQTIRLSESMPAGGDELIPHDPANTTPQLLSVLWDMIAQGSTMVRGESSMMLFPQMLEHFNPTYLNRLMAHFDSCKDVCDYFGVQTILEPVMENKGGRVVGFKVRSFRNPNKDLFGTEGGDDYQFDYDPFWDDGDDYNYDGIDEELDGESFAKKKSNLPDIVDKIPDDDDKILGITKVWVNKMMSDMGICPFTSGPDMAGLPIGRVRYTIDRCTSMEDMYARYWKEVVLLEQNNERELSTTLLICPEFCIDHIDLFENFSTTLTQPLSALGIEDSIQLVFFHPHWTFRDGGNRQSEEGLAANYARRSPWPMINILRTNQVRAAQKGIPTGLVYKQNEKTLSSVGAERLETMLRLRDWEPIANVKVNRRDMEALRVAQDYQETGVVKAEDTSLVHDNTPAANKVDAKQVEQGNLVRVVAQALEKRLGMDGTGVKPLSGPETSATIMASDFLLQELDRIIVQEGAASQTIMDQVNAGRRRKLDEEEMRHEIRNQEMMEELRMGNQQAEINALYGGAGIMDGLNPDESTGIDPNSFF